MFEKFNSLFATDIRNQIMSTNDNIKRILSLFLYFFSSPDLYLSIYLSISLIIKLLQMDDEECVRRKWRWRGRCSELQATALPFPPRFRAKQMNPLKFCASVVGLFSLYSVIMFWLWSLFIILFLGHLALCACVKFYFWTHFHLYNWYVFPHILTS